MNSYTIILLLFLVGGNITAQEESGRLQTYTDSEPKWYEPHAYFGYTVSTSFNRESIIINPKYNYAMGGVMIGKQLNGGIGLKKGFNAWLRYEKPLNKTFNLVTDLEYISRFKRLESLNRQLELNSTYQEYNLSSYIKLNLDFLELNGGIMYSFPNSIQPFIQVRGRLSIVNLIKTVKK